MSGTSYNYSNVYHPTVIRSQLRIRLNLAGIHEVYTTIHGSGVFRWFLVSSETADWYVRTFNLKVEQLQTDPITGALTVAN